MAGHRHGAAEVVARQIPVAAILVGGEHGDGERSLEGQRRRDQQPPDGRKVALGKRPPVAADQAIDDLRFARRPDLDRRVALQGAHLLDQFGAGDHQILDLVVDFVDLPPNGVQ